MLSKSQKLFVKSKFFLATLSPCHIAFSTYAYMSAQILLAQLCELFSSDISNNQNDTLYRSNFKSSLDKPFDKCQMTISYRIFFLDMDNSLFFVFSKGGGIWRFVKDSNNFVFQSFPDRHPHKFFSLFAKSMMINSSPYPSLAVVRRDQTPSPVSANLKRG